MSEPEVDDQALVTAAQSGCVQSFERLYRLHSGRVYALCLRLAGDPSLAEELTQVTFVRAWDKLASFRGDSAFGSWLFRIAVNAVAAQFRSEFRRANWESRLPIPVSKPGNPGLRMDLDAAIATLPPGARTVFVLHDVEGYRHEEIAEQTGIAVGTSKTQLHKARHMLREMIQP